jgi:hypothetical protein
MTFVMVRCCLRRFTTAYILITGTNVYAFARERLDNSDVGNTTSLMPRVSTPSVQVSDHVITRSSLEQPLSLLLIHIPKLYSSKRWTTEFM